MGRENIFAFLIHPPQVKDVEKKYVWVKFLPKLFVKNTLKILNPLVGPPITGFKLPGGEEVKGRIVICPLTAEQMLNYPELAQKKVLKTVKL
ncbi:MAG: shikimate dehydrogenase, partial [Candidatus Omnitrophica bacterium]|nr:shikimate dehydrogenase [Candidatus Omnitrophota bacterium]